MWTGTGSNGKSKLVALLKKTFGAYLYNISPAEIVSGVKAGAPEPQLDGCRGRRLVFTCEPDKNCSFNSSSIKRWTGNGELLNTRDVYKGTTEWTAQFRLFSVSNEIPRMSTVDDAIVRRARVIPFLYQFVQSPLNAIDRKADYEASGHFDSWKSDLMLYLLEKYREYSALECKKVALPTRCQTETDTYFDTTNPIKDTFNEVFNLVDDKNVFLSWGEITGAYYTHKRLQGDYTRFDDHCFQSYVRGLNGLKERRDKKNVNGASVRGFWGIVVREKPPAFVLDDK